MTKTVGAAAWAWYIAGVAAVLWDTYCAFVLVGAVCVRDGWVCGVGMACGEDGGLCFFVVVVVVGCVMSRFQSGKERG